MTELKDNAFADFPTVIEGTRGTLLPFAKFSNGQVAAAVPEFAMGLGRAFKKTFMDMPAPNFDGGPMYGPDQMHAVAEMASAAGLGGVARLPKMGKNGSVDSVKSNGRNNLYDPPNRPQRPFAEDYPGYLGGVRGGQRADTGKPLTVDMEGTPLIARNIVGRQVEGGPDVGLFNKQIIDARKDLGIQLRLGSLNGALGEYAHAQPKTRGKPLIQLEKSLSPEHMATALRHEMGHGIHDLSGKVAGKFDDVLSLIPQTEREALFGNYHRMATGTEPTLSSLDAAPKAFGYLTKKLSDREIAADAISAYLHDPNYLKTIAPEFARVVRQRVNSHPELSKHVQFNANPGESAIPFAADMAGNAFRGDR
jgi:hypothetical protein